MGATKKARVGGNGTRVQAIEKALAQKRVRCARASDYTAIHFQFQMRWSYSIRCPRTVTITLRESLHFPLTLTHSPNGQIKCAIINQQTLKQSLQFVLTALHCAAAAETNMPLITVSISDRDSRLAVKNASQDMALCALCNGNSSNGNGNPTYVQYYFFLCFCRPLFAVTRRSSSL